VHKRSKSSIGTQEVVLAAELEMRAIRGGCLTMWAENRSNHIQRFSLVRFALCTATALAVPSVGRSQAPLRVVVPELRVDPDAADLARDGAMLISPTGEILVVQNNDRRIRVFSATGVPRNLGRSGEGPGEFRSISWAGWVGDSLWTYDVALRRISLFGPTYAFTRSFTYPTSITDRPGSTGVDQRGLWHSPQALYSDGSMQIGMVFSRGAPMGGWASDLTVRDRVYLRVGSDGVIRNRVLVVPPSSCRKSFGTTTKPVALTVAFCVDQLFAPEAGSVVRMLVAVELDTGAGGSFTISIVEGDGSIRFRRVHKYSSRPIPKMAMDSARRAQAKSLARNAAARKLEPSLAYPSHFSPFVKAILGRDGSVWLEEWPVGPGHTWQIFDAKGALVSRVKLPEAIAVQVAEIDRFWAFEADEDGLLGIVRFRIQRPL